MSNRLILLFALLRVLVKHVTKVIPTTLRDENGIAEIALNFADCDVSTLRVLFARKEEILVLDTNMPGLRSLGSCISLPIIVFFNELL